MNNISVSKQLICYMDILGYKEHINNSRDENVFLKTIDDCIRCGVKSLGRIKYKMFSDNIIFHIEPGSDRDDHISDILGDFCKVMMTVQGVFAKCGKLLVRGSITYSSLYADDVYVYGNGLIQAYKLESEIAIFPRIILDTDLERYYLSDKFDKETIRPDSDGHYYLHYLSEKDRWESFKEIFDKGLNDTETRVVEKHLWCKRYYDDIVSMDTTESDISSEISDSR